jgi:hypothetical protein
VKRNTMIFEKRESKLKTKLIGFARENAALMRF